MVKLIFLCARRAGMTHAEYAAHLLDRHAPLALRHHATLGRYVLNVVEEAGAGADPIDSVNALHYASLEDFARRNYDSAEGERIVTADHARFLGAAAGYLTRERVYRSSALGEKWFCALRGDARLETGLVPELLSLRPGPTHLVVNRVERKLYDTGADWDALLEVRFASDADSAAARERIERFADASAFFRVAEYVQRA